MELSSFCPLRAAPIVWQPRPGAFALTVVVKGTFHLAPGVCPLAEAQEEPRGEDLVPQKARCDVTLVGHAFAPGGQPARVVVARVSTGAVDKRVEVWCHRIFWRDGEVLEGQPFTRMDLRPERAAFGPDNPLGMRFDGPPDVHGAIHLPHLQPPGLTIQRRGEVFGTTGFFPLPAGSPARAERRDIEFAHYNAAPRDQQLDALEPDQPLSLENLHPDHPRLETRLPGLSPRALMTAGGRAGEGVSLRLDTLLIDTDRALVFAIWRGRIPLNHPAEPGTIVISLPGAGRGAAEPVSGAAGEGYEGGTLDLGASAVPRGAPNPFAPQAPFQAPSGEIGTLPGARAAGPALPFGPAQSPWSTHREQAPEARRPPPPPAETGTLFGVRAQTSGVLPVTWSAASPGAAYRPGSASPDAPPLKPLGTIKPVSPPPVVESVEILEAPDPDPESAPPPRLDSRLDPAEVSLETCAAVAASIARRKGDIAQILEENRLDPTSWAEVEGRFRAAIGDETRRGKTTLLGAYDKAYVARLEAERGPITVAEYARLTVASERGSAGEALAEMTLPRGALIRIERVWLARVAADEALRAEVIRAITAAREA